MGYSKEAKDAAKAEGRCAYCLHRKAIFNRVYCQHCKGVLASCRKRRYKKLVEQGLCVSCGARKAGGKNGGKLRCTLCVCTSGKRTVENLKQQHRCRMCGARELATKALCSRCRGLVKVNATKQREKLRAAGLCLDGCGRPSRENRTKCQICSDKATTRARERYKVYRNALATKEVG